MEEFKLTSRIRLFLKTSIVSKPIAVDRGLELLNV